MKSGEKKQGLKEILLNFQANKFNTSSTIMNYPFPQKILKTSKKIEDDWHEINPVMPEKLELERLLVEIKLNWKDNRNFEKIKRSVFNYIPWLLFYGETPCLVENSEFLSAYLKIIRTRNNPSSISTLINVYLNKYEVLSQISESIREELVYLLKNNGSSRLKIWKVRNDTFKLLDKNAHEIFNGYIMKEDSDIETLLYEAGFKNQLLSSNFLSLVHSSLLVSCFNKLTDQKITHKDLTKIISFLEDNSNQLRFNSQKIDIVQSLLLPFKDGNDPTPEIQEKIIKFISRHFNDPVSNKEAWMIFGKESVEIMLRWNVHKTLNSFFKLIDKTAEESHWKYRKKFWMAHYEKRYITDAWIVLGKNAVNKSSEFFSSENLSYGILSNGVRNQSVLLFKVAGMTVCEWSHNGSCRIWQPNNLAAPKLYEDSYRAYNFIGTQSKPDFKQVHGGSENGT